jgi:hypothetical protein
VSKDNEVDNRDTTTRPDVSLDNLESSSNQVAPNAELVLVAAREWAHTTHHREISRGNVHPKEDFIVEKFGHDTSPINKHTQAIRMTHTGRLSEFRVRLLWFCALPYFLSEQEWGVRHHRAVMECNASFQIAVPPLCWNVSSWIGRFCFRLLLSFSLRCLLSIGSLLC